jgi:hypothetical protein
MLLDFRLQKSLQFGGADPIALEHHVAALKQCAHPNETALFQEYTKLSHANQLIAADVDSAQERNMIWHVVFL